jgi:hypothetical protein
MGGEQMAIRFSERARGWNMTEQTPPGPLTEKAERKAAAADINDPKIFQETEFGRRRVQPFARLRAFILLFGIPLTLLRQSMSRAR